MSVWAIGDLHLSIGGNKPMEVFRGWDDHVNRIEKNWNNLVAQDDTVVICGDVSWAMQLQDTFADFSFIHSLNGKKIIIKGNHDYWWTTYKKMQGWLDLNGFSSISILNNNAYLADGISICGTRGWSYDCPESEQKILNREVGRLTASIKSGLELGGQPIVFLHYPPVYEEYICHEITDVLAEYAIPYCYYGHLHGPSIGKAFNGYLNDTAYRLVSCDSTAFNPVPVRLT